MNHQEEPYVGKGVKKIFSEVPKTYEIVNHLLTLGLDVFWRKKAARTAVRQGGARWLDVCSGTGEMALSLVKLAGKDNMVVAMDFCEPMLRVAAEKKESSGIRFAIGDVGILPFPDGSFDLITISFAARNINTNREKLISILAEFYRVLKKGGRFVCLETSQPANRLMKSLFHLYVKMTVRIIGEAVSGSRAGYRYLSHTIPRFYGADEFSAIIRQAGFADVGYDKMLFGATAIHRAVK